MYVELEKDDTAALAQTKKAAQMHWDFDVCVRDVSKIPMGTWVKIKDFELKRVPVNKVEGAGGADSGEETSDSDLKTMESDIIATSYRGMETELPECAEKGLLRLDLFYRHFLAKQAELRSCNHGLDVPVDDTDLLYLPSEMLRNWRLLEVRT